MPLTETQAIEAATALLKTRGAEQLVLDEVRRYWKGIQRLPAVLPSQAPREVREMARMSRVNIVDLVIESLSQSLFVEGFRAKTDPDNAKVWDIWQANKMDARQSGIHRAAIAYGTAYAVVLPGTPAPVIRGLSPRALTAEYAEDDDDWPARALEWRALSKTYRLYDENSVYTLKLDDRKALAFVSQKDHNVGYVPIVRYREVADLDVEDEVTDMSLRGLSRYNAPRPAAGQVGPLMSLQDQVDVVTFNLLVTQHYAAFRQRYVVGWTSDDEVARAKATAAQMWTFEDPNVKVGDLAQSDLDGYIKSREASLRHAASLSQTPAHELIGELINLSAEALAAAEAGRDRKVADRQTTLGEAHEQTLGLAGKLAGIEVPEDAQARWRDTGARSLAAIVDALGKAATMLGIPPDELWERIPGVSQQDVQRWRDRKKEEQAAAEANPAKVLADLPPADARVTYREVVGGPPAMGAATASTPPPAVPTAK